jgi:hypothetical protein
MALSDSVKTFLLPVVALLAFAYYPEIVAADPSPVAVQQTVNAVEAARSDITTASRSLVGIRDSLAASKTQAGQRIIDEAWLVFETAGAIVTAGDIYERIKSKDDQSTVFSGELPSGMQNKSISACRGSTLVLHELQRQPPGGSHKSAR